MTALTPSEALEQVCPQIRACMNEEAVIHDGRPAMHGHINCAGPDCKMGWRWLSPERDRFMVTAAEGGSEIEWYWNPTGVAGYERYVVRIVKAERRGYCGFAGHPEVPS